METHNPETIFAVPPVWQDLVHDFLEMACFLRPEEQTLLIQELSKQSISSESIEVFPCFSINGCAVMICETGRIGECWVYYVKEQRIEKWMGRNRNKIG